VSLERILSIRECDPELYEHMLKTDLSFFSEEILDMEIVDHHLTWSDLVEQYPHRLAINAARDHGKSYFFSFAYIIWRVYFNWIPEVPADMKSVPKECLGYLFSNTETQAIAFLKIIKNEIRRNPKLAHLKPTERGANWAAKDITLSNGAEIRARGWGSSTRGGHPCLSYKSEIVTDRGVEYIGDLVGEKRLILTGLGTWKKAIFWKSGNKEVVSSQYGNKFTRDKSVIVLTEDHKVLAESGWKESKDLIESEIMQTAKSNHSEDYMLAGWYWNDGWYNSHQQYICFNTKKDGEAYELFTKYFTNNPKDKECTYRLSASKISHIVDKVGKNNRVKNKIKGLPELSGHLEETSWIRGMMSANGSVIRSVNIKLASKELLEFIELILNKYGCRTSPIVKDEEAYRLHIHKKSIAQYLSVFGFIQSYKTKKAEALKFKFYKNIKEKNKIDVFDFKVIDPISEIEQSAICNGVVVHNCFAICDDVLTDDAIYSEMQREKSKEYFYSAITPMVIPGGQIIVVGTPFHAEDLYKSLRENTQYHFQVFPAIQKDGKALWPTRYNKESLLKRREELGSTRFSRELLCVPISDDSSLFPEKILRRCFEYEFEMPLQLFKEEREDLKIYTGVDFAMSTAVGADYTVITTIAEDKYANKWILDIRRKKGMGLTEQLLMIQDVYLAYKPQRILLETNQMQRIFKDELVRRTDLPVEGFTTGINKNTMSIGVPSLQILFENQKFKIARKTERDREITDVLINELKSFTWMNGKLQGVGSHDDCVMSLWLAVNASRVGDFNFSFE